MNKLLVISGPSGVGKNTVVGELLKISNNFERVRTATTRKPRPGEVNGVDYDFLAVDDFMAKIKNGYFLEWARVHENYYGTPKYNIQYVQGLEKIPILVIDVQGCSQLRKEIELTAVFISINDLEKIKGRIENRYHSGEKDIALRYARAIAEIEHAQNYDLVVYNDDGMAKECAAQVLDFLES